MESVTVFRKPLKLSSLMDAYLSITLGYNEPHVLRGNPETLQKVKELVTLATINTPPLERWRTSHWTFRAAVLEEHSDMPDGLLEFETYLPSDGMQVARIYLEE